MATHKRAGESADLRVVPRFTRADMQQVRRNQIPQREMLPGTAYQIVMDEYPQTAEIEARCVSMLAHLWHAPDGAEPVGTSTTGSSEGCMLAGLALKRRWQHARREAGKPANRPNVSRAQTFRW